MNLNYKISLGKNSRNRYMMDHTKGYEIVPIIPSPYWITQSW